MMNFLKKVTGKKEKCCDVEIKEVESTEEKKDACCNESGDDKACC
jgi:hypothetical protein